MSSTRGTNLVDQKEWAFTQGGNKRRDGDAIWEV